MVTSSWRALPSVAISSEATRIFRRNIMFNLPTFSSSPTPDPSSAWYPLDRNDLQSSWYVLSEFDGLVKQFRDNRQACQLVQRSQEGGKIRTCSEFEMTDHRAIAINKCRPWSSVFAARAAFDSSKKPCRTAFLGGQIEKMRKLQIPMSAPISG
jgi:hypothetical protein